MGNGENEPIQFTRGDADRITRIDGKQDDLHTKLDDIVQRLSEFAESYNTLKVTVNRNRRFRRTFVKITLYVLSPSGLIVVAAKAFGWF